MLINPQSRSKKQCKNEFQRRHETINCDIKPPSSTVPLEAPITSGRFASLRAFDKVHAKFFKKEFDFLWKWCIIKIALGKFVN